MVCLVGMFDGQLYSYGPYSYGLYSYGLYSYGPYSYGLCHSHKSPRPAVEGQGPGLQALHPTCVGFYTALYSYGLYSYGLYGYGLYSHTVMAIQACTVMAYTDMAYIVMAYIVMAYPVMAYTVMAYTVMSIAAGSTPSCRLTSMPLKMPPTSPYPETWCERASVQACERAYKSACMKVRVRCGAVRCGAWRGVACMRGVRHDDAR